MYRPPNIGPVPVVISEGLQEATGVEAGAVLSAVIEDRKITIEVVDTVRYFPTMDPETGFMLTDIDLLLGHLNVLGLDHAKRPNEFFVVVEPEAVPMVREGIERSLAFGGRLQDRSTRLDNVSLDPLASSGWNAMVLLAVAVALLAAALGYVGYLLLSARLNRAEVGFLGAMGLSRLQLTGLLVFEHLAIVIVALGLGTWAGFRMSSLTVSPLAVTDAGRPVVPPFVLVTDWTLMAPVYAALAVILVAALLVLTRKSGRLDLQAIARLGEP
jgi:putative ABC transport system permease protein